VDNILSKIFMTGWLIGLAGSLAAAKPVSEPPDLTRSNAVDRTRTYNLGPTGLRGWIFTAPETYLDSVQGRTTARSRQILVTHVGTNSPAFGVVKVNDVILGVDGELFRDDARKSFGRAITEAEKTGVMRLTLFRAGTTNEARLNLRVLGAYSATAPYNCPKSKLILAEAYRVLEKEPLQKNWCGAISGLALLAAGDSSVAPKVRDFARSIQPGELNPDKCNSWEWGYLNLFLCEYYLRTGDKEVLPAIRQYTVNLARAQSLYGTFGHGGAGRTAAGGFHGSVPAYGPVNQAGLTANLAIVMGKKCGIHDPEIDPAIERASRFFSYYVGKGTIPYGEHMPWPYHENNGKSAMAAVFFGVQGDRVEAARYFAKMATAGYANREYGHTGQGFSYLWGVMGANMGGPAAAAAFVKEAQWHLDLVRRCDGSFTYDGGEQYGPGQTDDNTYWGRSSYDGLSPTACYVLSYAVPLRRLIITGRDARSADWLSRQDVAEAIASGRFDLDRKRKSVPELLRAFNDWSPVVRGWAAEELAARPEARTLVPELLKLAEGPQPNVRQAACETLGNIKDPAAGPVLVRLLRHEDRWLRVKAGEALKKMGDAALPALPEMLRAVADTAEPLQPISWSDPIQFAQGQLAETVFAGPLKPSLAAADRKLLYPAIRAVAKNADGMARARLRDTFANLLTEEDVRALAPDLIAAIEELAPADLMFANEIRMGALQALVKYRFREAIPLCVKFARTQSQHASQERTGVILKLLESYGVAAQKVLPELREFLEYCQTEPNFPEWARKQKAASVAAAIRSIEAATEQPQLKSLSP